MLDEAQRRPVLRLGAAYLPLALSRDPIVFVEGGRGTGKTASILKILVARALQYPGCRILLGRSHRTLLTETVLVTLEEQVFPSFGMAVPGGQRRHGRTEYALDNGTVMVPLGVDDGDRMFSAEWTFAYICEAGDMTQNQIERLQGSMRYLRGPGREKLPDFCQTILDYNPTSPGHWLNQKAEPATDVLRRAKTKDQYASLQKYNTEPAANPKKTWKRIITKHIDNPGYWDYDRWDWTAQGRTYVEDTLEPLTGYLRDNWLDGLWRAASGTVFPEFDIDVHVVPDFIPPVDWPWYIGWDPGFRHHTGVPWITVAPNGDIYVGDEIYENEHEASYYAEKIKRMRGNRIIRKYFGDPHEFFSSRAQGPSIAAQVYECGLPRFIPWANQKKQAMVNHYREALVRSQSGKPGPKMYVMEKCKNTIMEHQTWAFKKMVNGELPPGDDAFVDANNDLLDPIIGMYNTGALRYEVGGIEIVKGR